MGMWLEELTVLMTIVFRSLGGAGNGEDEVVVVDTPETKAGFDDEIFSSPEFTSGELPLILDMTECSTEEISDITGFDTFATKEMSDITGFITSIGISEH